MLVCIYAPPGGRDEQSAAADRRHPRYLLLNIRDLAVNEGDFQVFINVDLF
jgi:hypothetical protein